MGEGKMQLLFFFFACLCVSSRSCMNAKTEELLL